MNFWKKLVITIIYYIVTLYCKTWRFKFRNNDIYETLIKNGKRPVMAIWHSSLLTNAFSHRHKGIVTIASDSKDGDLITFALNKWGFKVARGSSTRGGVKAALNAIKTCKKFNASCAVTVDGPKGPRNEVKTGAIFIAHRLDGIIIVVIAKPKKFITFNSWDKFVLPLPFSSIEIIYSPILHLQNNLETDRDTLQKLMTEFSREINPSCL